MRITVAVGMAGLGALLALAACSPPQRRLALVPSLAPCLGGASVNAVRVTALGDFAPAPILTAAASAMASATLDLPRATRVVQVEGLGPTGLAAFGRSPPLVLDDVTGGAVPLAYGPPDGLCATAAPAWARAGHRATRLGSGAVLVTGGWDGSGPVTAVELYLPAGDASTPPAHFRLASATLDARAVLLHASAALADGGALVTGGAPASESGLADGIASQAALRIDGAGRAVGRATVLPGGPRAGHSATVLGDGRVLLAGGCQQLSAGVCGSMQALASTLIYDPRADAFTPGPPLLRARWGHDAILRGDGTVLLVGGNGEGGATPLAEIVDPDEARGFDAGAVAGAATRLPTGAALVLGDAGTRLWLGPSAAPLSLPPPGDARGAPTVTALDDGAALVAGGGDVPLLVYDGLGSLTTLAARFDARGHSATLLADGTVLLVGGSDGSGQPLARADVYLRSPLSAWSSLPPLTLDSPAQPVLARRPDRIDIRDGQLTVSASATPSPDGLPQEFALVAGMTVADFELTLQAGRHGAAGAVVLLGWRSEADFAFVVLEPGQPVELRTVTAARVGEALPSPVAGCRGQPLLDGELPDGSVAPLLISWRGGRLTVTGTRPLLDCRPAGGGAALGRGSVGVGARFGSASFAALALSR